MHLINGGEYKKDMDYKMLVLDLDDSLLGTDLKISQKNKKALIAAIDKGVFIIIATMELLFQFNKKRKQITKSSIDNGCS